MRVHFCIQVGYSVNMTGYSVSGNIASSGDGEYTQPHLVSYLEQCNSLFSVASTTAICMNLPSMLTVHWVEGVCESHNMQLVG